MTLKIGINGFGRIGRLALRAAFGEKDLQFVHVNDPAGDAATLAHLLNFDSVHGRWSREATADGDALVIDGQRIPVTRNKALAELGITGYGFAPLRLPRELDFTGMFHGVDERVPLDALTFGQQVLADLIRSY